jgi:hypothetical protein
VLEQVEFGRYGVENFVGIQNLNELFGLFFRTEFQHVFVGKTGLRQQDF